MSKTKIYFDSEFTGLHKNTSLISIGLVSENNVSFYAEFTDCDYNQLKDDLWLQENVIKNLQYLNLETIHDTNKDPNLFHGIHNATDKEVSVAGNTDYIKHHLKEWLCQFGEIEMYSDCLAYDWVLFNNIFGHAFNIPENIYYIPFDLCTAFKLYNYDPDISRELFIQNSISGIKHNALYDAKVIKACFEKLNIK